MKTKVYFIVGPGRIKIGYTSQPERRLNDLRNSDMEQLSLIGSIDGGRALEKKIHALVSYYQIKGEWFRDCPEVRGVIDRAMRGEFMVEEKPSRAEVAAPSWRSLEDEIVATMGDWMPPELMAAVSAEIEVFARHDIKRTFPDQSWHLLKCKKPRDWKTFIEMVKAHSSAIPKFMSLRASDDVTSAKKLIEETRATLAEMAYGARAA